MSEPTSTVFAAYANGGWHRPLDDEEVANNPGCFRRIPLEMWERYQALVGEMYASPVEGSPPPPNAMQAHTHA